MNTDLYEEKNPARFGSEGREPDPCVRMVGVCITMLVIITRIEKISMELFKPARYTTIMHGEASLSMLRFNPFFFIVINSHRIPNRTNLAGYIGEGFAGVNT